MPVPRFLKARLEGKPFDEARLRFDAWQSIVTERIRSDVFTVMGQFDVAFGLLEQDGISKDALDRVVRAARDGEMKTDETQFKGAKENFITMAEFAATLSEKVRTGGRLEETERQLGHALIEALRVSVLPEVSNELFARMIRKEVRNWLKARKLPLQNYDDLETA